MVFPPSRTRWTALALNSSVKLRLGLRGFLSSAMLDTVSASPKVSTGAAQANEGVVAKHSGAPDQAGLYSLVATGQANGVNPEAYLAHVLLRVQSHPAARIDELLPDRWMQPAPNTS